MLAAECVVAMGLLPQRRGAFSAPAAKSEVHCPGQRCFIKRFQKSPAMPQRHPPGIAKLKQGRRDSLQLVNATATTAT
jgi:hypothetical protein